MTWPVVPICNEQRIDVRPEDLIQDGLYRKCDTYRGGGGYDQFSDIHAKRHQHRPYPTQFVVQLYGCPLSCPYCYLTKKGVFGEPVLVTTENLIEAFTGSCLEVFHLMGGAPALYLENWKVLAEKIKGVFHSDFLLVEKEYELEWLENLPGLHAVSLKHFPLPNKQMMWKNLDLLVETNVDFYITFTGIPNPILKANLLDRYGAWILEDSFIIPIINYGALNG